MQNKERLRLLLPESFKIEMQNIVFYSLFKNIGCTLVMLTVVVKTRFAV